MDQADSRDVTLVPQDDQPAGPGSGQGHHTHQDGGSAGRSALNVVP